LETLARTKAFRLLRSLKLLVTDRFAVFVQKSRASLRATLPHGEPKAFWEYVLFMMYRTLELETVCTVASLDVFALFQLMRELAETPHDAPP